MAVTVRCACGRDVAVEDPTRPTVRCDTCGSEVALSAGSDVTVPAGEPVVAAHSTGPDAQLAETHRVRRSDLTLDDELRLLSPDSLPPPEKAPVEPGRCRLCGLRNRSDDIICEGCGTNLATGEPPPVERFKPRRFDARILAGAGAIVLASLLVVLGVRIFRSGADARAVERGAALARAADWKGAEREFTFAIATNPRNAAAATGLAEAQLETGSPGLSAATAEGALRLGGGRGFDPAAARFVLGRARLALGSLEEASSLLETCARERPDLPGILYAVGEVRFRTRRRPESLAAYEQALLANPRSAAAPLAKLRVGVMYADRARFADGEKLIREALAQGAPKAEGLAALGDLFARSGKTGEALASYGEAVKAGDGGELSAWTWYKIARLRWREPNAPLAIEALAHALATSPGEPEFLKLLGHLREETGSRDEAVKAYVDAATRSPKDPEPEVALARLELGAGHLDGARPHLEKALALDPQNLEALSTMGELAASKHDWKAAADAWKRARAQDPSRADTAFRLGVALFELDQKADALNAYRDATTCDPAYAPAWEKIADIHESAGRAAEACIALSELVRLKPLDTDLKLRLARLRMAGKRYDLAKRLLEEVLEADKGNADAQKLMREVQYREFQEK